MTMLYNISGYKVYFPLDISNEPIHVCVCRENSSKDTVKFWITRCGGVVLAHNRGSLSEKDINKLTEFILSVRLDITASWLNVFGHISYIC